MLITSQPHRVQQQQLMNIRSLLWISALMMDDFLLKVGARVGSQLIRNQSVRSRSARSFPSWSPGASVRLTCSSSTTADERVSGSRRSSVGRVFQWAAHLSSCQGTNTQNWLPQQNIFCHKTDKICQLCTWTFKLSFFSCYVPLKKPKNLTIIAVITNAITCSVTAGNICCFFEF